MADRQYLETLSKQLADEGKLIEAGWVGLRLHAVALNAPASQLSDMRYAFMAGAQHLFASIMTILDPGEDPTTADLLRMELISDELESFRNELELRVVKTKGSS